MKTPILDPANVPKDWETDVFGLVYPNSVWDWTQVRPIEERDIAVYENSPVFEGRLLYVRDHEMVRRSRPVEYQSGWGLHADGTPMSKEEISEYLCFKWSLEYR